MKKTELRTIEDLMDPEALAAHDDRVAKLRRLADPKTYYPKASTRGLPKRALG